MEPQIFLVHWHVTNHGRIACGATGHCSSTRHLRGVTCTACLRVASEARAKTIVGHDAARYVN